MHLLPQFLSIEVAWGEDQDCHYPNSRWCSAIHWRSGPISERLFNVSWRIRVEKNIMNCQWNCRSGRLRSLAAFCKTIGTGTVGWLHVFSERWGNEVVSSCNVRCTKDCPASHEKYEGRGWRRCHRNGTQPISSRIRTYHQRQTAVGYQLLCTCLRGAQSRRAMCSRFWEFGIGCCSPLKIHTHTQTPFKHISDSIFNVI